MTSQQAHREQRTMRAQMGVILPATRGSFIEPSLLEADRGTIEQMQREARTIPMSYRGINLVGAARSPRSWPQLREMPQHGHPSNCLPLHRPHHCILQPMRRHPQGVILVASSITTNIINQETRQA